MSAVKIFALGVLVTGISAGSTRGGSMQSSGRLSYHHAGPRITAPTGLSIAPTPAPAPQTFAAANLAPPSGHTPGVYQPADSGAPQGTTVLATTGPAPINMNGTSFASGYRSYGGPAPVAGTADAFINFGSGPYPEAGSLTTGNAASFDHSPAFTHLFANGQPTAQDVRNFEATVVSTIQQTYRDAGLNINLTADPNAPAARTMSVVSGASYSASPDAIGITDVGNNGFSFIDKFGQAATPLELATAIGHNLSHELMHAFGIADHPEQSGPYVDAATTTWATLADPNTGFSQAAGVLLSTLNFQNVGASVASGAQKIDGDQILVANASPVPEPSTVALWGLAGGLLLAYRRREAA